MSFVSQVDIFGITVDDDVGLRGLDLKPGMSLEVYVTEAINPHHFMVQPHGTDLVEFMKVMG